MQFLSYNITKIDEEKGHLYVTFTFDTEVKEKKFDYRAIVGYDDYELHDVSEQYKDKEGRIQTRTVKKTVKLLKHKSAFNLGDKMVLNEELKDWVRAYMIGKAKEDMDKQTVAEDVRSLIGKKNTTSL